MEGEEEGVEVVREALEEAVQWVEGVAGEGGGDLPYVVRFVKQLVDTSNAHVLIFTQGHATSSQLRLDLAPVNMGTYSEISSPTL